MLNLAKKLKFSYIAKKIGLVTIFVFQDFMGRPFLNHGSDPEKKTIHILTQDSFESNEVNFLGFFGLKPEII